MTQMILYTGGGVSLSPIYKEGMTQSVYIRLVADKGKALKKGAVIAQSIDILPDDIANWTEIDEPEEEPESTADELIQMLEDAL